MTSLSALLAAYAGLDLKALPHAKGEFHLVAVTVAPLETLEVGAWPDAFDADGCDGWVRYRSALCQASDPWEDAFGPPLAGEWVGTDGATARLAPHPSEPGRLQLVRVSSRTIADDGEARTPGETAALRQREWLMAADGDGYLSFEVYWGFDASGTLRRLFDRFTGFAKERS